MALTRAQKLRLIAAYEPTLYHHPEERFHPIDPAHFVEHAALWCTQPADAESRHRKENWGRCSPGGEGDLPHEPLIPHQGVSLDPAHDVEGGDDPDGDGVNEWYLGHESPAGTTPYLTSEAGRMLWLEGAGWEDEEGVTETSLNEVCGAERAAQRARDEEHRAGADRYYADAEDLDDLRDVFGAVQEETGLLLAEPITAHLGRGWILVFHYFFAVHEAGDHQLWSYEGDWNAVAVVVAEPEELRRITDPGELSAALDRLLRRWEDDDAFPEPAFVGYGRRARGVAEDGSGLEQMLFHEPDRASLFRNHPAVYVSHGSHNLYPDTGEQDPLASAPPTCEPEWVEPPEWGDDVATGLGATGALSAVAKVLGGTGIGSAGGPIGAGIGFIVGLFCALAELLSITAPIDEFEETTWSIPPPEHDLPPEDGSYGVVLAPSELVTDIPGYEDAAEVRRWANAPDEKLIDRATQPWWRSIAGHRGYDGRWGAMCQRDPCDARSGMEQPDFRRLVLMELSLHLSG